MLGIAMVDAIKTPTMNPAIHSNINIPEPACHENLLPAIFGVSKRVPALLSMRGGQVHEPETLEDVQAIILKAGSEQKLVVIDFSATW